MRKAGRFRVRSAKRRDVREGDRHRSRLSLWRTRCSVAPACPSTPRHLGSNGRAPEDRREAIGAALRLQPDLVEAQGRLGRLSQLHRARRCARAQRTSFERHSKSSLGTLRVLAQLAWYEFDAGRYDSATAHYRTALTYDPRSIAVAMDAAWSLLYVQGYAEADSVAAQVTALAPDDLGSLDPARSDRHESIRPGDKIPQRCAGTARRQQSRSSSRCHPCRGSRGTAALAPAVDKIGMKRVWGRYALLPPLAGRMAPASEPARPDAGTLRLRAPEGRRSWCRKTPEDTEALYRLSLVYAGSTERSEASPGAGAGINVSQTAATCPWSRTSTTRWRSCI